MKQKKETHAQSHCERSVAIAKLSNRRAFTLAEGATHVDTCDNVRKNAFTLAEVLITLAIIVVVAAMTIPTLITDYKEKQTISKVKKAYYTISNAHKMIEAEKGYGVFDNAFVSSKTVQENSENLFNLYKPYLRISKDCGFEMGCWTEGYIRNLVGNNYADYTSKNTEYKVMLMDGTMLMFYANYEIDEDNNTAYLALNVKVDVNGFTKPYQWGRDVFLFDLSNKGVLPYGHPDYPDTLSDFENNCNLSSSSYDNGLGCTAWVIQVGNMDYLHCDDLSWSEKHKCSD